MIMTADLHHVGMIGVTCRREIKAETGKNCRRLPLWRASVDLNDVFLPVSSRAAATLSMQANDDSMA